MTLITQNHDQLIANIQRYGCRFRCLQAIAEFEEKKALSIHQIMTLYTRFSDNTDIMNHNCLCGPLEHHIIHQSFQALGNFHKTARQVGMMHGKVAMGWDKKPCAFDYMILHWKTYTKDGHYTLANKEGQEIFDPYCCSEKPLIKERIQRKLLYKVRIV